MARRSVWRRPGAACALQVVLLAAFTGFTGFTALPAGAQERWQGEIEPESSAILVVEAVHHLFVDEYRSTVTVVETFGGDPVINGNRVLIAAKPWDPFMDRGVYRTGIDVTSVTGVWWDADTREVVIEAAEQIMTGMADVVGGDSLYRVALEFDDYYGFGDYVDVVRVFGP